MCVGGGGGELAFALKLMKALNKYDEVKTIMRDAILYKNTSMLLHYHILIQYFIKIHNITRVLYNFINM